MTPDRVRAALGRILASSAFQDAERAKSFLSFIVTAALEGRGDEIKESVIAVEALGRSTAFDPKTDPIVRVEAGRLRQRLKVYYDSDGAEDSIVIMLPKGTYVPEFNAAERPAGSTPVSARRPIWIWPLLVSAVAGLSAAGIILAVLWRGPSARDLVQLSLLPPHGWTIESSRVSPDGRAIAFTAFQQGRTMLWIRTLDAPEPKLIPGTETASQPFWSPDSRSIGFFNTDRLLSVDVRGGPPQEICPVTIPMGGGAWGRDGTIVFSNRPEGVLYKVRATGGTPTPTTVLDERRAESAHRFPEFLPDGKHFLYVANSGTTNPTALRIASLESTDSKVLLEGAANASYAPAIPGRPASLLFYFQGRLMAQAFDAEQRELRGGRSELVPQLFCRQGRADFSIAENGTLIYRPYDRKGRQLAWYDRSGRLIEKIAEPNDYFALRLSPDDQRLVFVDEEPDWTSGVWVMELATKRLARVSSPGSASFYFHPVWSPDANEIIYANGSTRGMKLLRQSVTGTAPTVLLDSPGPKFPTAWSADGRFVTFFTPWPDFVHLKTLLVETKGAAFRTLLESHYNEAEAVFSPARTGPPEIAYTSTETGRPEVYVRSFPNLEHKVQISTGGGWQPIWRGDGRELFYLSPDGTIMAVSIAAGDYRASPPRPLFRTNIPPYPGRPELPANSYAAANDGTRFLVNQAIDQPVRNTISVVSRW